MEPLAPVPVRASEEAQPHSPEVPAGKPARDGLSGVLRFKPTSKPLEFWWPRCSGGKGDLDLHMSQVVSRGDPPAWAALCRCRSLAVGPVGPAGPASPSHPASAPTQGGQAGPGRWAGVREAGCLPCLRRTPGAAPPGAQLTAGGLQAATQAATPTCAVAFCPVASRAERRGTREGQPGHCGAALGTHCRAAPRLGPRVSPAPQPVDRSPKGDSWWPEAHAASLMPGSGLLTLPGTHS